MKSPAQIREKLNNAIINIRAIQKYLTGKSSESVAGIGVECNKTAELLAYIINNNHLPEVYKVAVVGRFKAGKSSFVNELLESKLAGEDTSPETAAVTTFTYGAKIEAKINFIEKAAWVEQQKLFKEDPKNIDAHRAKMWDSFSKPKKNADGMEEKYDLHQIESSIIKTEKNEIIIQYENTGGKSAEKKFREQLKMYTSGSKPYHCLVSSINITTPSNLLKEGIELIDTPGLGDTERFRVSLTEHAVEQVDAILLLTKSGVAYGQEEKDFLLSILRKGSVKQLMIVITQVDQTYQQHVKSAKANDEEPQTITQRIAMERFRIKEEIRKTLDELSGSDSAVTRSYIEQFSNVEILFTSVMAHRDNKENQKPDVQITAVDPGGLIAFKSKLTGVLSTESRFAMSANLILNQSNGALQGLAQTIEGKINAIRNTKNREEVERRLQNFRTKFKASCKGIADELSEIYLTFKESTDLRLNQQKNSIENVVLKAGRELNKFRTLDVGRHWRTRRSENWGYMYDLQSRVANKIFPAVQEMLESHVEDFATYVKRHDKKISKLTKDAAAAAIELELGKFSDFDIKKQLNDSSNKIVEKMQTQILAEQQNIMKLLETFITEEVGEKITEKRNQVSDIWGKGTTAAQQHVVNQFYDTIENILAEALTAHVSKRNFSFAMGLVKTAEHAPKETFREVDVQLENAMENLRQAAEMTLAGQKEQAEKLLLDISSRAEKTASSFDELLQLLNTKDEHVDPDEIQSERPTSTEVLVTEVKAVTAYADWTEAILASEKELFAAHSLREGEVGWPFSRIFPPALFSTAQKIRIVDPYLVKSHQLRNLQELLLLIVDCSKPKAVEILTEPFPVERQEYNSKQFDDLSRSVFSDHGITLELKFAHSLHDRYIFSDSGYVVILGRGLDFYKPSAGLASHRQEIRKVRPCEINIFKTKIS